MTEQMAPLVETQNVKKAKSQITKAVKHNEWVSIVAEVGSGKTHLYNHLLDFWQSRPDKFIVHEMKAFISYKSKVPSMMKELIQKVNPDANIPGFPEARYRVLKDALIEADAAGKKVILLIDECQDLSVDSFRDLKKVHEIAGNGKSHLFTIAMFGKLTPRYNTILSTRELGYRMTRVFYEELSNEDLILIAESRFGLSFKGEKAKLRFCSGLRSRTPLGVQDFAHVLEGLPSYEGKVTDELIMEYATFGWKLELRLRGSSQKEAAAFLSKLYPQMSGTKQKVSDFVSGKLNPQSEEARMIEEGLKSFLPALPDIRTKSA